LQDKAWIASWVAAQQLTEPRNMPPPPGLSYATLRQIAQVTVGGNRLRVKFSNLFGSSAVSIGGVHIALAAGGGSIDPASDTALTFNGSSKVKIAPGMDVVSDEVAFHLEPLTNVAVTVYLDQEMPDDLTGHPGSRTTSYIQRGCSVASFNMREATQVEHWYLLSEIDVLADSGACAVVTLGDSITDGRGSTTNKNNRWPNMLARRLLASPDRAPVAVLNQGIGGNRVLDDGLGPSLISRLERDGLTPPGVRWLIVLEGINDIGTGYSGDQPARPGEVAAGLIAAYRQLVDRAHSQNLIVYGGTLMPFEGSFYFTPEGEADRQTVNAWIRTSDTFDGVIDLDAIARDPSVPTRLSPAVDGGDHLHPSAAGYKIMADAIDLSLFESRP